MAHTLPLPPPGFDELPVEDQVQYIEALRDRVAAEPRAVSVPDWHRQLLSEPIDRVVAFVDLLGFTSIVEDACAGDPAALERVRAALRMNSSVGSMTNDGPFGAKELTPNARATVFSDSIVDSRRGDRWRLERVMGARG